MRVDKNANRQRGPRKSALWCHRICDRAYFPQISKPFHNFQLICTRAQKDAVISLDKQTQERKTSRSYDDGQRRFEQFKRNCKISKVGHPYLVSLLGVQRSDAFLGPTIKQLSMGLIWSSSDHLTVIIIKMKKNHLHDSFASRRAVLWLAVHCDCLLQSSRVLQFPETGIWYDMAVWAMTQGDFS